MYVILYVIWILGTKVLGVRVHFIEKVYGRPTTPLIVIQRKML